MSSKLKIGETKGNNTVGFGGSRIKWYASDSAWSMVLLSGDKKLGELHFESMEQMLRAKENLGCDFRITPR